MSSILDLPIERQKEIASEEGVEFNAWVEKTKKYLAEGEAFRKRLDANKGIRPEGMTEDDVKRFQRKIDSGNP